MIEWFIRRIVSESIVNDIKRDVIRSLNDDKEFKKSLKKYTIKKSDLKSPSIWTGLELFEVQDLSLKIRFTDDVGIDTTHEFSFKNLSELVHERNNITDYVKNSDAVAINTIDANLWVLHKGQRILIAEYFLKGYNNYRLGVLDAVLDRFLEFSEKHPELMI